jgi:Zn-finger nucleic acid-binding protein
MPRNCPVCTAQALVDIQAGDTQVESCPGCGGLWFDPGTLERFPHRPSAKHFHLAALHAPNRCRKGGHAIGRALAKCARCGGAPALCPACGARLAMVPTPVCAVDVCTQCEGIWLDAGEFELLEKVNWDEPTPAPTPAAPAARGGWEVPAATDAPAREDPWRAPGQSEPLSQRTGDGTHPFTCRHCGAALSVYDAWAYDGDSYCDACRPKGAVSGRELPPDFLPARTGWVYHRHYGWWGDILEGLFQVWTSSRGRW